MTADREGEWLLAPLAAERETQRTGSMQLACTYLLHRAGLELIPMRARRAVIHRPYDPDDEDRPLREAYDYAPIPLAFIRALSDYYAAEWWKYGDENLRLGQRRLELYGIEFLLPQALPAAKAQKTSNRKGRPRKSGEALCIFVQRLRSGTTERIKSEEGRAIHAAWSKPNLALPDTIADRFILPYHSLCRWDDKGNLLNADDVVRHVLDDFPDLMAS